MLASFAFEEGYAEVVFRCNATSQLCPGRMSLTDKGQVPGQMTYEMLPPQKIMLIDKAVKTSQVTGEQFPTSHVPLPVTAMTSQHMCESLICIHTLLIASKGP